jgi:hypothetical protein
LPEPNGTAKEKNTNNIEEKPEKNIEKQHRRKKGKSTLGRVEVTDETTTTTTKAWTKWNAFMHFSQ